MYKKIITLMIVFMFLSSNVAIAANSLLPIKEDNQDLFGRELTGESIYVEVAGYEPTIVPASVLNDQNVPVYVYLKGSTLGGVLGSDLEQAPFYGLPEIKNMQVVPVGQSSNYVSGINYVRPLRNDYLSDNRFFDLGYLIVNLRKITNEDDLPDDLIDLNLSARIEFELNNAFGDFGAQDLVLSESINEESWKTDPNGDFWGRSGYIRVEKIENNRAVIVVYDGFLRPISKFTLKEGDESSPILVRYGERLQNNRFRVRLNQISSYQDKADVQLVYDGKIERKTLIEGSPIYYGSDWVVKDIKKEFQGGTYEVVILENSKGNVETLYRTYSGGISLPGNVNTLDGLIDYYSKRYGSDEYTVDPDLIKGLIKQESKNWQWIWTDSAQALLERDSKTSLSLSEQDDHLRSLITAGQKTLNGNKISTAFGYGQITYSTADDLIDSYSVKYPELSSLNRYSRFDKHYNILFTVLTFYDKRKKLISSGNSNPSEKEIILKYTAGSGGNEHAENILNARDGYASGQFTIPLDVNSISTGIFVDDGSEKVSSEESCSPQDIIELKDVTESTNYKRLICTSINELQDYLSRYGEDEDGLVNYYLGLNYMKLRDYDQARTYFESIPYGKSYSGVAQDKLIELVQYENDLEEPVLYLDDENVQLKLKSIELNEDKETKVTIRSGSFVGSISVGANLFDEQNNPTKWYVDEIAPNYIVVKANFKDEESTRTERVYLGKEKTLFHEDKESNFKVNLENIESFEEAYLTVLPGTGRAISESNFVAHIAVEDYGISFSDEQIDAQINWTENAIKDLTKIIDKLDNVIQIGNKLCWSFWGFFTLVNIFNPSERKARSLVMNGFDGSSGIKEICENKIGFNKEYDNYDECVFANREVINELIDASKDSFDNVEISSYNLEDFESIATKDTVISEDRLISYERLNVLNNGISSVNNDENGFVSGFKGQINKKLNDDKEDLDKIKNAVDVANQISIDGFSEDSQKQVWTSVYSQAFTGNLETTTYDGNDVLFRDIVKDGNNFYYAKRNDDGSYEMVSLNAFESEGSQQVTENGYLLYKDTNGKVIASKTDPNNRIRSDYASTATAEIYANGRVYLYPIGEGNYVEVLEYYETGSAKTVQKWNVGADGELGTGDDILLKSDSELRLPNEVNEDRRLKSEVNGKVCEDGDFIQIRTGQKFLCSTEKSFLDKQLTSQQCTDVFSITQCQVLFNFCDPVMCPASRFNLGGRYEVGNVVQTGLIGSLVLGMPNWAPFSGTAQFVPPICLTGVSSSAKSYRSMLEGYNECLRASKERGENVGICEKIRSVFWCELAWREASAIGDALINVGSTKDIYGYLGGKGGGEYSNLQSAATYVSDSSSFFTKEYAKNAFAAYKARSTAEIGTQLCQAFIGAKGPNFGEFFDELTQPESPPQFTAYFDEKPWSSDAGITVANSEFGLNSIQEQSLYNVYYHIYAGEDRDARYTVFLRDDFGNVAYVTERAGGSLGYIPQGGFADENIDFIGRSGYTEICVVINGQVECGFGKSSTSFALNRLSDTLVNSDANRQIDSKEKCVPEYVGPSTNIGGVPLVLPTNVPGVTTTNGIVRLCSIDNPGKGSDKAENYYESVGTCGSDDLGRNLGSCWIDLRTVTRAIDSTDFRQNAASRYGESTSLTIDDDGSKELYNLINEILLATSTNSDYFTIDFGDSVYTSDEIFENIRNEVGDLVDVTHDLNDVENRKGYSYRDLSNYNFGEYGKLSKIKIAQIYYAVGVYLENEHVPSVIPEEVSQKDVDSQKSGCCNVPIGTLSQASFYSSSEIQVECKSQISDCEFVVSSSEGLKTVPATWIEGGSCQNNKCVKPSPDLEPQEEDDFYELGPDAAEGVYIWQDENGDYQKTTYFSGEWMSFPKPTKNSNPIHVSEFTSQIEGSVFDSETLSKISKLLDDKGVSEQNEWINALEFSVENNNVDDSILGEYLSLMLTIIEKESSFNENPPVDMEVVCNNLEETGNFIERACCNNVKDKIESERDYVDAKCFGIFSINSYHPKKSIGAMEISVNTALEIENYNRNKIISDAPYGAVPSSFDRGEMYDRLFDKNWNLYYGGSHLLSLIDIYAKKGDESYDFNDEVFKWIFADYNSGKFSSRNAAFQQKLNLLTDSNLDLDGDLGIITKQVLESYLIGEGYDRTALSYELSLDDDNQIIYSKTKSFEDRGIYKFINSKIPSPYAIVPKIKVESIKFAEGTILSVEQYATSGLRLFRNNCLVLGLC